MRQLSLWDKPRSSVGTQDNIFGNFLRLRLWVDLALAPLDVGQYLWEFPTFETLGRLSGMQSRIKNFSKVSPVRDDNSG
ncbi:24310_t:CDS:2, partial [Dentiscutata erythropus]